VAESKGLTGATLYALAGAYALSSAAAFKDGKVPAADRDKLAGQYAARAVQLLRQAQAAGHFRTRAHLAGLKKDADLDPLRSRADFKELLARLEKK
jgi:hypothetical protein